MVTPEISLLQFETNTTCNAACSFCEKKHMTRKGNMKTSQIIELLYRYAHKSAQICPFGMQEPTLEPRLSMILANAKQLNPNTQTYVYTNMGVYDKKAWTEIIRWGTLDYLMLSYYAPDEETYNKLQPGLNFHKVASNIEKLVKLRRRLQYPNPKIFAMLLITPETYVKSEAYVKRWENIVDKVGMLHFDSWRGKQPYSYEQQLQMWGPNEFETWRAPCSRLWSILLIHVDGTVVPCCLDHNEEHPVGNIFKEPDLFWNNEELNKLRQMHVERRFDEIPLCRDCMFWRYGENKEWIKFWQEKQLTVSYAANP